MSLNESDRMMIKLYFVLINSLVYKKRMNHLKSKSINKQNKLLLKNNEQTLLKHLTSLKDQTNTFINQHNLDTSDKPIDKEIYNQLARLLTLQKVNEDGLKYLEETSDYLLKTIKIVNKEKERYDDVLKTLDHRINGFKHDLLTIKEKFKSLELNLKENLKKEETIYKNEMSRIQKKKKMEWNQNEERIEGYEKDYLEAKNRMIHFQEELAEKKRKYKYLNDLKKSFRNRVISHVQSINTNKKMCHKKYELLLVDVKKIDKEIWDIEVWLNHYQEHKTNCNIEYYKLKDHLLEIVLECNYLLELLKNDRLKEEFNAFIGLYPYINNLLETEELKEKRERIHNVLKEDYEVKEIEELYMYYENKVRVRMEEMKDLINKYEPVPLQDYLESQLETLSEEKCKKEKRILKLRAINKKNKELLCELKKKEALTINMSEDDKRALKTLSSLLKSIKKDEMTLVEMNNKCMDIKNKIKDSRDDYDKFLEEMEKEDERCRDRLKIMNDRFKSDYDESYKDLLNKKTTIEKELKMVKEEKGRLLVDNENFRRALSEYYKTWMVSMEGIGEIYDVMRIENR